MKNHLTAIVMAAILVYGCGGDGKIESSLIDEIWQCSQAVHKEYPALRTGYETSLLQYQACAYIAGEDRTHICRYLSDIREEAHCAMCVDLGDIWLFDRNYPKLPKVPDMPRTEQSYIDWYAKQGVKVWRHNKTF